MTTPITFNPTVTTAGQAAAVNAANNGLQLSITAISFGTGNYVPSVGQTALTNQVKSITIGAGALVNPNQIRMSAVWSDNVTYNPAVPIYEVGFWAGSVLFAVWSAGGGSNPPLGYKSTGVNFVLFNDLYFSQLPPGSVTVQVDSGQSAFLTALTAHETASNAHPQYQLVADYVDGESAVWCGLAGGTANNIILTLPASQTAVTQYNQGQRYVFKAALSNTGAVTAQVVLPGGTTLAAQAVTKTGTTALNPGDIAQYAIYMLFYDGINGAQFQLSGGAGSGAARTITEYTITAAQALANATAPLSLSASYTVGLLDAIMQGRELSSGDFTATDGATVQFPAGTFSGGESIRLVAWSSFTTQATNTFGIAEYTLAAGATSVSCQYTPGLIQVRLNGSDLSIAEYTATDGATIQFGTALQARITAGDLLQVAVFKSTTLTNVVDLSTTQTIGVTKIFTDITSGAVHLPTAGAFTFRNKLFNGAGNVNQRGYVTGTATTVANQYTIDRWKVVVSGQNLSWVANGAGVTFTAPAGGVSQIIEAGNIEGGTYILSWIGTATATVGGVAVANGGTVAISANTQTTVTFSGGTFSSPQLELGTFATPFEWRPVQTELALCQRYFLKLGGDVAGDIIVQGYSVSSASISVDLVYPVKMRTIPTGSIVGTWTKLNSSSNPQFNGVGLTTACVYATCTTTGTFFVSSTTTAYLTFDADI